MATIFSRIVAGQQPAYRVHETARSLAFLDINPKSEGHTLVIPKREVANFEALPLPDLHDLIGAVQVVANGVTTAMGTPHYNVTLNNGGPAGQVVFHVHFHVIPRYADGARFRPTPASGRAGPKAIAEEIRQAIATMGPLTP